ncbi:hypothetical protein EGW08_018966 [Elysia chlorotica]|uniref:Copper transport protein n=1 Tax=Elysia chlorotica TaxID=188477 RepID=A0A3S0Z8N9_ELYCH|nr:hypothetical protein EGW08_018966 [Elysia chlorotica]
MTAADAMMQDFPFPQCPAMTVPDAMIDPAPQHWTASLKLPKFLIIICSAGDLLLAKMYFHFGPEKHLLFHNWHAETPGAMIGACCAIFCLAVLYEGLKELRSQLQRSYTLPTSGLFDTLGRPQAELRDLLFEEGDRKAVWTIYSWRHLVQTLLHMVQAILSYSLMMVFMTFNLGLCLALVLGLGVGYFLFGWTRDAPGAVGTQPCN